MIPIIGKYIRYLIRTIISLYKLFFQTNSSCLIRLFSYFQNNLCPLCRWPNPLFNPQLIRIEVIEMYVVLHFYQFNYIQFLFPLSRFLKYISINLKQTLIIHNLI